MGTLYNRKEQKPWRQYLRTHSTRAEIVLWYNLKGRQMLGYKFRRQHGVGQYVLDFYCPELRLALEIDGESHDSIEARVHDEARQRSIEEHSIQFLRFRDEEVLGNINGVLKRIAEEIVKLRK
jgi:very-short-patch-repair endonuclease